jgi:DNA-directed RNA polymerase subunit RPC12/RpoP
MVEVHFSIHSSMMIRITVNKIIELFPQDCQKQGMTDISHEYTIHCRYCRHVLYRLDINKTPHPSALTPRSVCGTVFLDDPEMDESSGIGSWLYKSTLNKLEGVLECPRCGKKVGAFKWQGEMCACGEWIVPCIGLSKSKVDVHLRHSTRDDTERRME